MIPHETQFNTVQQATQFLHTLTGQRFLVLDKAKNIYLVLDVTGFDKYTDMTQVSKAHRSFEFKPEFDMEILDIQHGV